MAKEQVLQAFGLTPAEIAVYLTLLQVGEATASQLAKKTNANRTFTYDRLKKLQDAGLVGSVVKEGKKYFKAAEPAQLLAILKEREEQIREILPELEQLKAPAKPEPKVELFSSKKGIRTVLNLVLRQKAEVLIHGSMFRFQQVMESYYDIWNKQRTRAGIRAKVLTNEEIELPLAQLDLLAEEERTSSTMFVFGDTTIITLWSDMPVAILIKSSDIALAQTAFFKSIWEREIRIYSGVPGIRRAWMDLVAQKGADIVGFGFSWELAQIYGREFSDAWHRQRLKNKVAARIIAYDDPAARSYFGARTKEWPQFAVRLLDRVLSGPACVTMSRDLIVTFLYTEKAFRVIISRNKEMIAVYRKHFETLWAKSAPSRN
jgi:sugar-specific transcriptional regulator TrmB